MRTEKFIGVLLRSTFQWEGGKRIRIGQKEKLGCCVVSAKVSANPKGSWDGPLGALETRARILTSD